MPNALASSLSKKTARPAASVRRNHRAPRIRSRHVRRRLALRFTANALMPYENACGPLPSRPARQAQEGRCLGAEAKGARSKTGTMTSLYRSIAVAAITFGASVVGMLLQWAVPADVLTASKGSVGAMVGLITLLLALVLGLLVFTAFSVYTTQQTEAQELGPVVIELDVILEQYGADVAGARTGLREALGRARRRFFGDVKHGPQAHTIEETRATMYWMNTYFDKLQPPSERHRQLLTSARDLAKKFAETNMLMARQLANPFPPYVLAIVGCCAVSWQRHRGGAECDHGPRPSRGRGRHWQRDFSHPRTEHALYGPHPAVIGRSRPDARGSEPS